MTTTAIRAPAVHHATEAVAPADTSRSPARAVAVTTLTAVWAAVCFWPDFAAMPFAGACTVLLAAGLGLSAVVVARQPGRARTAALLAVAGGLWPLNTLGGWPDGIFPVLRGFGESVFWVVLAAAILLFQNPHLGWPDWAYLSWTSVQFIVAQAFWIAISRPEWAGFRADVWWPTIVENRELFDLTSTLLAVLYIPTALVFSALMISRQRRSAALDRYSLTPVVAAIACAALAAGVSWASYGRTTVAVALVLLPVPAAFVYSATRLSRLRLRLTEALASVPVEPDGAAVTHVLQGVLRDPGLSIRFWSAQRGAWIDEVGRESAVGDDDRPRVDIPISRRDGRVLAQVSTVVTSQSARREVEAAVRLAAAAIENSGLRALVRAQVEAVGQAHARTMKAGLEERRRLEQDLHDGAQQRLVGVLTSLALAKHQARDLPAYAAVLDAESEVHRALVDLRDLARGLHPSVLAREGLGPALTEVARGLAVPVEVTVSVGRCAVPLESTAYFVACEALTNVAKHARADRAWVAVHDVGAGIEVDVRDDGIGGADVNGHGVSGMADRVIALGGRFTMASEPGAGTCVRAWLPCG